MKQSRLYSLYQSTTTDHRDRAVWRRISPEGKTVSDARLLFAAELDAATLDGRTLAVRAIRGAPHQTAVPAADLLLQTILSANWINDQPEKRHHTACEPI